MIAADRPFVLLDDARDQASACARLYRAPVRTVVARAPGEVAAALDMVRAATAAGLHAAGWLAFEAGHALEPKLAGRGALGAGEPLLWFGLFEAVDLIAPERVAALLPDPAGAWAAEPVPLVTQAAYAGAFACVQALIAAGDLYQVNLTYPARVAVAGDPRALYAGLRERARAGFGALVWTGEAWLLSLSPELFFTLADGVITTRPMKGTAARAPTAALDRAAAERLAVDPKQRAENLMIVDLLRNDLSRVAVAGSVKVPALFTVETYPSLHQMTSTVTAALAPGRDAVDVLAHLFPCGSVTGAPKIRATEVIDEVEAGPRGVYTGAIGRIDAGGGAAAFNVAIRTLRLPADGGEAAIGLGSGIVADSLLDAEWAECRAKGVFVASEQQFDLIETMLFDPEEGLMRLERHLARLKASAELFRFAFNRHTTRNELQAATFRLRVAAKVRLVLAPSGAMAIEVGSLPVTSPGPMPVALVARRLPAGDLRLLHKTTAREAHEAARANGRTAEVVMVDEEGFVTEGSWSTVFVQRGEELVTPPLSRGLLPGVLRAELIEEGRAIEGEVRPEDLANGFWLGNAVRGLWPAVLVADEEDTPL